MILINLLPHREARRLERKRSFFAALGLAALIGVGIILVDEILVRTSGGKRKLPPLAVGIGIYLPMAVTTNLNINFLRMPQANRDLIAECKMLKIGRALAIGEVYIYSEGLADPVAHATGTYSIPPKR